MIIVASFIFASEDRIIITKDIPIIYFALGRYHFNNHNFDEALNYFQKTIQTKPDFAEAYHNLGITYYRLNEYNNAIIELKKAIELKTDYAKAYHSLALVQYKNKDHENAISNLLKVIQLEPENANAHFDLAVVYVDKFREKELTGNISLNDLGDLKEALIHYLKVADIDPNFPHALSNAEIAGHIINDYKAKL